MNTDKRPTTADETRRSVLKKGVTGALAIVMLGAKGTVLASNMLEADTPGLTEGPYWVDEMLMRSDVRSDPSTGVVQAGLKMTLAINVSELNADGSITPLTGVFVDIWHCNASGIYSDIAVENTSGQKFLRGYQVTNAHGNVGFVTIYPGWYSGRTPHIHVRVRVYDLATDTVTYNYTTQLFFDDAATTDVYSNVAPYNIRPNRDTTNETDNIFTGASQNNEPAEEAGEQMFLRLFENRTRAAGSFNIVLDLTDTANEDPTGGTESGGGAGPGGGTGGTPPGGGTGGTPPGGGTGGTPPGGGTGGTPPGGGTGGTPPGGGTGGTPPGGGTGG